MTADSWRWTGTGAAVICNISEIMLRTLGQATGRLSGAMAAQLLGAAEAASGACACWREVTAAWTDMTTGIGGLTAPGIADTSDLVVRLGRLAFTDPGWTPIRSRSSPVRTSAQLAPDTRQAAVVAGAIHHAAEALACVAAADACAVRTAVCAGRIYVPTRTLPEYLDVPHRYWRPPPARAAALIAVYDAAAAATDRLVSDLDLVAVTMNTPSRIRAVARAAIQSARDVNKRLPASDRAGGPAVSVPAGVEHAVSARPGWVERAVRNAGSTELVVLMRARAMDAAARKLIEDAKESAQRSIRARSAASRSPMARSAVRMAAESFPAMPANLKGVPSAPGVRARRTAAAMAIQRDQRSPRV